jgi:hypothetical protein
MDFLDYLRFASPCLEPSIPEAAERYLFAAHLWAVGLPMRQAVYQKLLREWPNRIQNLCE